MALRAAQCPCPWAELEGTPRAGWPSLFSRQLERPTKQMREAEERLKAIPQFCFPDAKDWLPVSEYNRWVLQSCSAPWSGAGVHWNSLSLVNAQLRKQQFESWPLCDQAAVFNFSFFWSSVFFFFPILPASQACVAEGKRLEGSSEC